MAQPERAPQQVDKCRPLLQGLAKNLADRLYGAPGPAWGTRFSDLEATAGLLGRTLQKYFLDLALSRQAATFVAADAPTPCPRCGTPTQDGAPEPRIVQTPTADAEGLEPARYCPKCRKAYFPQSHSLGIDLGHSSTSLLDLLSYSGANKHSFREASADLHKLAGVRVPEKQVERVTKRSGSERLAERDDQVERFLALNLVDRLDTAPKGVNPPDPEQVAVVLADAGLRQRRDQADQAAADGQPGAGAGGSAVAGTSAGGPPSDAADGADGEGDSDDDQDKPPPGRPWHEDKVALVLTRRSRVQETDPCPEVPATFLDPDRVARRVRGLKKAAPLKDDDQPQTAEPEADGEQGQADDEPAEYEGPKWEKRQAVASRKSWPVFGAILASAAWLAGFAKAQRQAFVADGARALWRVWRTRFRSYVPILDFIHALSYVYAAAKAVGPDAVGGWALYAEWIVWVWRGKVVLVIDKLQEWQSRHGSPGKGEAETSPRQVVAKALRYFRNHQGRMKYAEYRKQGLPVVRSLVESMVKQISRRVKGTEKFGGEDGAEAILQLRADSLSDGEVMEAFWQRRQAAATGQRTYRTAS